MAKLRYFQAVPTADPVVGANRLVTTIWSRWFQFIAQRIGVLTEQTQVYDPPSIAAGSSASVTVTFTGARAGDKAYATHTQVVAGIILLATATTDAVTVTFLNMTAGAIDIASGTLRVGVESNQ